jgi:hypothetical protein
MISNFRREYGYTSLSCNAPGHIAIPAGISWSIGVGAAYIQFADLPDGKDVGDYFVDYMVIELTPDEDYQPVRTLLAIWVDVANDRVYFHDYANSQYVPIAISGDGDAVRRLWGTTVLGGKRSSLAGFSISNNEESTLNMPTLAFAPYNRVLDAFGASGESYGQDAQDILNHRPVTMMASAGTSSEINGGVCWFGGGKQPAHPRAFCYGPPKAPSNWFGGINTIETKYDAFWRPGMGDMASSNFGRLAIFFPLTEEDGQTAWAYNMDLLSAPWLLKPLRIIPATGYVRPFTYAMRCYVDAAMVAEASNKVSIYAGGTASDHTVTGLTVGWHTFTGSITPTTGTVQINHNRNVYVSWFGIDYT